MNKKFIVKFRKKRWIILEYFILVSIQSTVLLETHKSMLSGIIYFVLVYLIGCLCYKGKYKILYISFYLIYIVFIDVITVLLGTTVYRKTIYESINTGWDLFVSGIVTSIIALCSFKIFIDILIHKQIKVLLIHQQLFFVLFGAFELFYLYELTSKNMNNTNLLSSILFSGIVVILDVYLIYLFELISNNNELITKCKLLEQHRKLNFKYYSKLEMQLLNYKKMIHDIRHHVVVLSSNIPFNKEYGEELKNMLNKQISPLITESKVLNIIIGTTQMICEEKKIELFLKVDAVNLDFISDVDITTIFSNLLENAVEASEVMAEGERKITLEIHINQWHVLAKVENRCKEVIPFIYKIGESSKENHMGLGLANVTETIDRYQGSWSLERKQQVFRFKLVIPIE